MKSTKIKPAICRCGRRWWPRKPGRPAKCPTCHDPNWDKPRQRARRGSAKYTPQIFDTPGRVTVSAGSAPVEGWIVPARDHGE